MSENIHSHTYLTEAKTWVSTLLYHKHQQDVLLPMNWRTSVNMCDSRFCRLLVLKEQNGEVNGKRKESTT